MSSFFSRFGARNKSRLTIAIDVEEPVSSPKLNNTTTNKSDSSNSSSNSVSTATHRYTRHNSVPNTPSTIVPAAKLSVPIVDPLPPPSAFRTIEQFPLCVAYVQAIKTSSLPACTLSSEKILRQQEVEKAGGGSRRGRAIHRHHVSTKSADLDWTKKLYVLVPGILLQYSGEGMDDRLPEKVLQLTASSLAFASDAIPGRPWVLQVYSSAGEDGSGALVPEKRNAFIAKVTFWGSMRNCVSAILLVFESAEDMDGWMGALRMEAARLGGKPLVKKDKPLPKIPRTSVDLEIAAVEQEVEVEAEKEAEEFDTRFSRRIVINRDDSSKTEWSSSDENASKRASTCRNSTDAERSIISHDQIVLDQLRGSRLSLHSGGDTTRVMTVQMSPDTSPERYSTKSSRNSYKRRSQAVSTQSRSSIELRLPPHGLSAIDKDGNLYWIPRTPSPSNKFALPSYRTPRTSAILPVPAVPSASRPLTTVISSEQLEESQTPRARRPRPVSIQTMSPYQTASPKSTPSPSTKPRPVSMLDSPSKSNYHYRTPKSTSELRTPKSSSELLTTVSAPSPATQLPTVSTLSPVTISPRRVSAAAGLPGHPPPITIPYRSRSLRRRSLGALENELARGAPKHPPPSMPLPKVPSPVVESLDVPVVTRLSQSVPRSTGGNWGAMEKRRRRSRQQQTGLGLGISLGDDDNEKERERAEQRHSFCAKGSPSEFA
ncbi:hypothetical protein BZA05DRAFT_411152 [Tricharina praecox]|uniref:uncharacterized protein n=1 Tax=Tricharina praecox TaxID=43433 RepID=UPI0022212069|nr:uncharacterized protein BZA05DRAFT_411152 [Tricharina praecox]KAI5843275.1 hypothetical protein BZA05DRAFT_411152 [Tricharina praecox]